MDSQFEENDFFNFLTSKLSNRYKDVIENCYSLCLPQNGTYESKQLNENFISLHILKPSPLLKSHFVTCNRKLQNLHVQFKENKIIVRNGFNDDMPTTVAILAEQKAYNNSNQAYNIYLIEKPFLSSHKRTLSNELAITNVHQNEILTQAECKQYLSSLSSKDTKDLHDKIIDMFETLILLPEYVDDVRLRLKRIIENSVRIFNKKIKQNFSSDERNLSSILECFCLGLVHDRLLPLIQQRCQKDDQKFYQKCLFIQKQCSSPLEHGAQNEFENFIITNDIHEMINSFTNLLTPLEKIKNMHRILDRINDMLKQTVEKSRSPLKRQNSPIYITSDDLIATLVYILTNVLPSKFCSEMFYIETFNFTTLRNSELQYSLVTFQVASSFILNYRYDKPMKGYDNQIKQINNTQQQQTQQNRTVKSINCYESQVDKEFDKMSKLLQNTHQPLSRKINFDDNLGSFLGSLADNFLITSGNKYI